MIGQEEEKTQMKGTKWMILLCAAMLSCGMTVSAAPFDPAYYAAQNPDVVQAVGEDEAALELHYSTFGAAEGRAANAQEAVALNAKTPVSFEEFDPAYYAEQNPDVTVLLGTDPAALYAHYVLFGAAEGRLPKAPEVVDPYARFASSDTGSRSSRHSDDDDDDDDEDNSGSAGSGSAGSGSGSGSGSSGTTTHEPIWGDWKPTELGTSAIFHKRTCTVAGCTISSHTETNPCRGVQYEYKDGTYHTRTCPTCNRADVTEHTVTFASDADPGHHTLKCQNCRETIVDNEACKTTDEWKIYWGNAKKCGKVCVISEWNAEHIDESTLQDHDLDETGRCKHCNEQIR